MENWPEASAFGSGFETGSSDRCAAHEPERSAEVGQLPEDLSILEHFDRAIMNGF
jgi:hypothetical protein